jgi:PadR family transcriptional regulator AphA
VASLTTVSYALLGLLAGQPMSAYEIERQMQRSGTQYLWPRTRSRVFKEPKNLVDHGLATACAATGKRRRTVYTITDEGRSALAAWLGEPGRPPRLEWEALLKVWSGHHGTLSQMRAQLATIRDQLRSECEGLLESIDQLDEPDYPRADRLHLNVLLAEFILAENAARLRWVEQAEATVADWSSTGYTGDRRRDYEAWLPSIRRRLEAHIRRIDGSGGSGGAGE